MTKTLGEVVRSRREELGLSKRALARESGVDPSEILRIEKGKRLKPGILALKGICETLNLSLIEVMKLAGYSEVEINYAYDITSRRSTTDYQNQFKEYERFYFDVLSDIDERTKIARECKGIFSDIIDRIDYPEAYNETITLEEISKKLKEASRIINRNTEKLDKKIYPNVDINMLPKTPIKTSYSVNTLTGKLEKK